MDRPHAEENELNARRLFSAKLPAQGEELLLEAEAVQHLRVLRCELDDRIELFDGRGNRVQVRISELAKRAARVVALGPVEHVAAGPRVVLVQCLPKGTKLDDIVRMTTELGVAAIHLAVSERCVARVEGERGAQKLERLTRIAQEAARQSEQAYLPELWPPAPLAEVVARAPGEACRVAFAERTAEQLPPRIEAPEMWVCVGPEGGLSSADRAVLTRNRFALTALGRSILRTETAAVVGVAMGLDRLGQRR